MLKAISESGIKLSEIEAISYTKKAKFNKVVTIVEGLNSGDLENALKNLKRTLACGGTSKDNIDMSLFTPRESSAAIFAR